MRIVLTIACALSSLCTVVAVQKPSVTKTSLSESELRTLARLSTFALDFNFFHWNNSQNAACGAGFIRLSPRKAV